MKHGSIIVAALLAFLVLPGEGRACGLCIESWARYTIPTYHWLLLVLFLWGMAHTMFGERWHPLPGENRWIIAKKFGLFLVVAIVLVIGTGGSTVLVALLLGALFAGTGYRMVFRGTAREGRILALVTALLLTGIAGVGMAQRLSRDQLDNARANIIGGTTALRGISSRIAKDPGFDLERLRPMIVEGERNDREWAFDILRARKNPDDLERFASEIAALPDAYFDDSNWHDSGAYLFRFWLEAIDEDLGALAERFGKDPPPPEAQN